MKLRDFNCTLWVIPFQDESRTQGCDALMGLGVIDRHQVIEMANLMPRLQPAIFN